MRERKAGPLAAGRRCLAGEGDWRFGRRAPELSGEGPNGILRNVSSGEGRPLSYPAGYSQPPHSPCPPQKCHPGGLSEGRRLVAAGLKGR